MDEAETLSVLHLPDSLLLKVFMSLPLESIGCVARTCTCFNRIAHDELLWRRLFQQDFRIPRSAPLRPEAGSWRAEYRRLYDETPAVLCEEVTKHDDEVLHVSFSHNGKMFATSSKDNTVRVWSTKRPCRLRFSANLGERFRWLYTRATQFNSPDTLLLVVGVVSWGENWKGEVVVFDLEHNFRLVSRFLNAPHNWYSAWYDDSHLLTGTLRWTNVVDSLSAVWLSKASREVTSGRKYATINPFRFRNSSYGYTGMMMVANVPVLEPKTASEGAAAFFSERGYDSLPAVSTQNPGQKTEGSVQCDDELMAASEPRTTSEETVAFSSGHGCDSLSADSTQNPAKEGCLHMAEETAMYDDEMSNDVSGDESGTGCGCLPFFSAHRSGKRSPHREQRYVLSAPNVSPRTEKLLIFTFGVEAKYAHSVGVKRMTEEEIRAEEEATEGLDWPEDEDDALPRTCRDVGGSGHVTNVDHTFNMEGRIIGMALSPDERYLHVNVRRWPDNHESEGARDSFEISKEIEVHILDLVTFTKVDTVLRSHRATMSRGAFIYLNVNELYVVSGAENNQGYLWDRHYGVHVRCFPHNDSVNGCAINPVDTEMMVTVSDDCKIKIWRSRRQMRELNRQKR